MPKSKNQKPKDRQTTRKVNHAVKVVSAHFESALYDLLINADRIEYNGAELYLVGSEVYKELLAMENQGTKEMGAFVPKEYADFSGKTFRLHNKDKKLHAIYYRTYMRTTPLIIPDPEKAYERIKKEIGIWKNVQEKGLREALNSGAFSEEDAARMTEETERKTKEEIEKLNEILENYDDYEVIVTNYETAVPYPTLYYTDSKGKKYTNHLSIKVPNILWYEDEVSTHGQRGDANIAQFVKSSTRIASRVYVKKKNDI